MDTKEKIYSVSILEKLFTELLAEWNVSPKGRADIINFNRKLRVINLMLEEHI
jgi:hypothetical protein